MSPTHPGPKATSSSELREYAAELWARIHRDRSGSVDGALRAATESQRSAAREDNAAHRPGSVPAPVAAADPATVAEEPARRLAEVGLGALASAWPAGSSPSLARLTTVVSATGMLWGRPVDEPNFVLHRRESLQDRKLEAIEFVSARFYAECRREGVSVDAIEEAAHELARWLGTNILGSTGTVFAPKRGYFSDDECQLSGAPVPVHHASVVQGLTFGIRRADGSVSRRAWVEQVPLLGGGS